MYTTNLEPFLLFLFTFSIFLILYIYVQKSYLFFVYIHVVHMYVVHIVYFMWLIIVLNLLCYDCVQYMCLLEYTLARELKIYIAKIKANLAICFN